ncbi:MAG: hypothetical protein ACPMAQ_16465, partial [Phycisphaerae bacterium]
VRQGRLNAETQAEAGDAPPTDRGADASLMARVRELTAKLKAAVFRTKPSEAAGGIADRQRDIRQETVAVAAEVKKKIPTNAAAQPPAPPATQGTQPPQVQAYIEAGKHLDKADFEMATAIEGLEKAVVENSLKPMQSEGPVQPAQANALEELKKALAALQPPRNQPPQNGQDRQKPPPQPQKQPDKQDVRREVERQDNERERAQRELYRMKPREVIKDW